MKIRRRPVLLDDEIARLVEVIARLLRGGASLHVALADAASQVGPPLGSGLLRSIASSRAPLLEGTHPAVAMFEATVGMARELGGSSAQVFDELAVALRSSASVRRDGQALASQGRLSALIIALMPLVFTLFVLLLDPAALVVASRHPLARASLITGLVVQSMGFLWIRRLTSWLRC